VIGCLLYMDVLNEYFEIKNEDVYYTFKGEIATRIKGGIKNPLYGKRKNLTVMYNKMMCDVANHIESDDFLGKIKDVEYFNIVCEMNKFITDKYGITVEWVYNKINNDSGNLSTDKLFDEIIRYRGGVDKISWMKIYDHMQLITVNDDILMYIAKEILSGSIYKYFVDRYNLRVIGVTKRFASPNKKNCNHIVLNWESDDGVMMERLIMLSHFVRDKRDWWYNMTRSKSGNNRVNIQDYDLLLNGSCENEILPDSCPIDSNIILNYTGIDFSANKDNNINECKHNDGMEEVWSSASIDRKDSTKPYTYDNVEIISHYYNTQVKNCASVHQISKLNMYQIDKMVKSIHRNEVEFSKLSDKELVKYISLYESVLCTYDVILDKTSRYMDEYKRRNPEVFEENVI